MVIRRLSVSLTFTTCLVVGSLLVGCGTTQPEGPERTQARWNGCAACHGSRGEGNAAFDAPPIAGLPRWYVDEQLKKFQDGRRGAHIDDRHGLRMRGMVRTLLNAAETAEMADFVASLPTPPTPHTDADGDVEKGELLYKPCVSCHGDKGQGKESMGGPPIAHQADWYMKRQLANFKHGIRGAAEGDARGARMAPMADTLADEAAVNDVVAYIKTLSEVPTDG